ncbi:MAG TPA: nicotinate-nucleotide--dimethylbenzimidazole phosphoribosyltransferase [Microscillaceae bacterium]|nr:nicotinate-nucleotide--dimethylbenzimidazole phosphoribosyltransferase [Microscillaceae bacterium]
MIEFSINAVHNDLLEQIQQKIDTKTKPIGALGQLEAIVRKICLIQNTLNPALHNPHLLVFAGDHGIAQEGVSKYPSEVTYQMVLNFLSGGAAINVFCRQNDITLKVVDAGVAAKFESHEALIDQKVAFGTESFLDSPAMTLEQCVRAINLGADTVTKVHQAGGNIVGLGEMGIGNTASAAVLMHLITKVDLSVCVGRGTGLDDEGLQKKIEVLQAALDFHQAHLEDIETQYEEGQAQALWILSTFGGFEIAQMVGAFLKAAELGMIIMVDGFIASSAFLVAQALYPDIKDYGVFCHQSDERGHAVMLKFLDGQPVLNLGLRLGEGTGAALAYPLLQAAVGFLNEMASFESAGVSKG